MAKLFKGIIILTLLISLASFMLGMASYKKLQSVKERNTVLAEENQGLVAQVEVADQGLAQHNKAMKEALSEKDAFKQEAEKSLMLLSKTRKKEQSLLHKVSGLNDQIAELDKRIEDSRSDSQQLLGDMERIQQEITEDRSSFKAPEPLKLQSSATIVSVNKAWNYAILDKGGSDGIRLSLTARVQRGERLICEAKVVEIDRELSVLQPIPESLAEAGAFPQAGDLVLF